MLKVGEREKFVGSVEFLIVLAVASFDLAIVPWGIGPDQLVADTELGKGIFKECRTWLLASNETVGEFRAVIRLDALNEERELLNTVLDKQGRRLGAVFLEGFEVAETAELIKEGVLKVSAILGSLAYKAGGWDEFHINLDALTGILHLLVGFGDVLGVR